MKNKNGIMYKFHDSFVNDDCVQISLGFKNYLMLFGDGDLRYFKNFLIPTDNIQKDKNSYLVDYRSSFFPYSTIPEHVEKVSLFKKRVFVNQIFDFNKPYILVRDGTLLKNIIFKESRDAYIYCEPLIEKKFTTREILINREQLEDYYKKGILPNYDSNNYSKKYIINVNGSILDDKIITEEHLLENMKNSLIEEIDNSSIFDDIMYYNLLLKAVENMNEMIPCIIVNECFMIKFKDNGDMSIDKFSVKYYKKNKYIINITNIPVNVETLEMIKSNVQLSKIRMLTEPKISLMLNPNISREQLKKEKNKTDKNRFKGRKKSIIRSVTTIDKNNY